MDTVCVVPVEPLAVVPVEPLGEAELVDPLVEPEEPERPLTAGRSGAGAGADGDATEGGGLADEALLGVAVDVAAWAAIGIETNSPAPRAALQRTFRIDLGNPFVLLRKQNVLLTPAGRPSVSSRMAGNQIGTVLFRHSDRIPCRAAAGGAYPAIVQSGTDTKNTKKGKNRMLEEADAGTGAPPLRPALSARSI